MLMPTLEEMEHALFVDGGDPNRVVFTTENMERILKRLRAVDRLIVAAKDVGEELEKKLDTPGDPVARLLLQNLRAALKPLDPTNDKPLAPVVMRKALKKISELSCKSCEAQGLAQTALVEAGA